MSWFHRLNGLALFLCFGLVVLGAYVRLSNAGLGCPDWPGCYGHLAVPQPQAALSEAQADFPSRPVEAPKAWKEMIHRYLAGVVAALIAALAVLAAFDRAAPRRIAFGAVGVVIAQIVFGALTVTMQVNPLIVTTHLLLGLTTLSLLAWCWLASRPLTQKSATSVVEPTVLMLALAPPALRALAPLALLVVAGQIFLGGWTSTNYAALACPDFPACAGSFAPRGSIAQAFTLWHGHDRNYEYGILDPALRATIHLVHRYGAVLVTLVIGGLAAYLLVAGHAPLWRRFGLALFGALSLQVCIGVGLIEFHFPLWLADAHNAGAALLLRCVVALNFFAARAPRAAA